MSRLGDSPGWQYSEQRKTGANGTYFRHSDLWGLNWHEICATTPISYFGVKLSWLTNCRSN